MSVATPAKQPKVHVPAAQKADVFLNRYVPAYGKAAQYAKLNFNDAIRQLER